MINSDDVSEEEILTLIKIYSKIKPLALKEKILNLIESFHGSSEEDS